MSIRRPRELLFPLKRGRAIQVAPLVGQLCKLPGAALEDPALLRPAGDPLRDALVGPKATASHLELSAYSAIND